jgi:hypothetical protein
MSYRINWTASIVWVGDGAGPMEVPSAQVLTVNQNSTSGAGSVVVPGANAPSTANISTACTTVGTNMAAALNVNIGQIQGFATGGQ